MERFHGPQLPIEYVTEFSGLNRPDLTDRLTNQQTDRQTHTHTHCNPLAHVRRVNDTRAGA